MDNEVDGQAGKGKNKPTRVKRVVERYDSDTGVWHRVEVTDGDELLEMSPEEKDAYLDIVTSISDLMITGNIARDKN